jgi:hypothetical protein
VQGGKRVAHLLGHGLAANGVQRWRLCPHHRVAGRPPDGRLREWRHQDCLQPGQRPAYITRTYILQGRSNDQEEWRTLNMIDSNRQNDVDRSFLPVSVRYVRLYVVSPTQAVGMDATRIYEFDLW